MTAALFLGNVRLGPPAVMAGLALISGILSAWLGFTLEPAWLKPIARLFFLDSGSMPIGIFFGVAMALGMWLGTRQALVVPVTLLSTLYAWSAAINVFSAVHTSTNDTPRVILASLAAGAVGAILTHLSCAVLVAELRRPSRIALTTGVGAVAGLIYFLGDRNIVDIRLLFLVWQPAVAYCIGLGLVQRDVG